MSEKYTISKKTGIGQHGRIQLFKGDKQKFIGSFELFEDAELVCRLLNENENFLKLSEDLKHKIEAYDLVLSFLKKENKEIGQ